MSVWLSVVWYNKEFEKRNHGNVTTAVCKCASVYCCCQRLIARINQKCRPLATCCYYYCGRSCCCLCCCRCCRCCYNNAAAANVVVVDIAEEDVDDDYDDNTDDSGLEEWVVVWNIVSSPFS